MKAKHFKLIRKRVSDEDWLKKELWKIANVFDDLNHFHKFECSEFFRGRMKAEMNLEKYNSNYDKASRKRDQIEWFMNRITVKGAN